MRIALLIVIFIASVVVVNPFYNYPVGDDWVYALSVKHLVETGSLRLPDDSAASMVFQVLWGYLFCLPFGFSFTALHFSTLALSLAGLLGFYRSCELAVASSSPATSDDGWVPLVATLAVWFNPVYFTLSFTFFTDLPFYALMLLSLYFFVKSQSQSETADRGNWRWFFIASLLSCCAVLVRQYAIVLPFAVGVLMVTEQWSVRHRRLRMAILSLPFLVLIAFYTWLVMSHGVPTQFRFAQLEMLKSYRMAHDLYHLPFIAGYYVGLCSLPVTVAVARSWITERWRGNFGIGWLALGGLLIYAVYVYLSDRRLMPYLTDSPITPMFGSSVAALLTILSALSGAVLVQLIHKQGRSWIGGLIERQSRLILGATLLGLIASGLLASGLLDRLLLGKLDQALTAYYQHYTARIPANQPLDYWRGRIGEFYGGGKQILYGLMLLGVALSSIAMRLKRRRLLQRPTVVRRGGETAPTTSQSEDSSQTRADLKLTLTLTVGFIAFFILISCRFDRYIFILFPIVVMAALRSLVVHFNVRSAAIGLIIFAVVAIASAKTMIGGYGALWTAGQEMLKRGVPIEELGINYTFNAYSLYLLGKRDITKTGNPSYWVYAQAQTPTYITSRPEGEGQLVLEVPFTNYLKLTSDRVQIWNVVK